MKQGMNLSASSGSFLKTPTKYFCSAIIGAPHNFRSNRFLSMISSWFPDVYLYFSSNGISLSVIVKTWKSVICSLDSKYFISRHTRSQLRLLFSRIPRMKEKYPFDKMLRGRRWYFPKFFLEKRSMKQSILGPISLHVINSAEFVVLSLLCSSILTAHAIPFVWPPNRMAYMAL